MRKAQGRKLCAFFISRIGVRPINVLRHAVIHTVIFRFPPAAAVETIIPPIMLADARAFQCVPIPETAVHEAVGLVPLPVGTRAEDDVFVAIEFGHRLHPPHGERGAGAGVG